MRDKNVRLVFSTDTKENKRCARCKELVAECRCAPSVQVDLAKITAVLRIEKAGRGGKTVTVIDQLPKSEKFLKELTKELKKKSGSGGTHLLGALHGTIEIQGDKRDLIREFLSKKGIKVKG